MRAQARSFRSVIAPTLVSSLAVAAGLAFADPDPQGQRPSPAMNRQAR